MATHTDNYALVKSTYGELADVAVINGNMDTIDGIMHSNRTMLAPAFSQTEDYAVGDVVVYEGNLYRFIVPHTAGNWYGTDVEQTTLGEEVSTKGGADVTKTASGNPIEISDGASAPLVKCVTQITGSQDLHGYDKPWVGGAGKNKLPNNLTGKTESGITFTVNSDGTVVATGTATGRVSLSAVVNVDKDLVDDTSYILSGCPVGGSNTTFQVAIFSAPSYNTQAKDLGNEATFQYVKTSGDNFVVALYIERGYTCPSGGLVFKPMIRLSTETDPTFTPYSNICPITAYTEGEIEVRGKNLVKQIVRGYINPSNKLIKIDNNSETILIKVERGETYTFSAGVTTDRKVIGYVGVDELVDGTVVTNIQTLSSYTWIAEWSGWTALYINAIASADIEATAQVEKGSTATDYEPYVGTTHTATYPHAIYRGSEDVVNGTVSYDMPVVDFGSLTWTIRYTGTIKKALSVTTTQNYKKPFNGICENYEVIGSVDSGSYFQNPDSLDYGFYYFQNAEYPDSYSFYVVIGVNDTPDGLCAYELATPTTSSVTPTNLPIKSLFGYNHIESSTGDMEVEYITEEYQPLVDLIQSNTSIDVYSTTPRVVGKWFNGEDVYEVCVRISNLQGGFRQTDTGISTDYKAWIVEGYAISADTATEEYSTPADGYYSAPGDNQFLLSLYKNTSTNHWDAIHRAGSCSQGGEAFIKIRYVAESTTPNRSLNLTKSAVEEIPDEIKNAEYEEKPDVNEADDSAPTEEQER